MPQELQVVRCCACGSFQGMIVKKDKTWVCKLCNQKQTTQMVYGRGSGKDCRVIVQNLNIRRLLLAEQNEDTPTCEFPNTNKKLETEEKPQRSRWREFLKVNDCNNGIVNTKKRSISPIINIDEVQQNIHKSQLRCNKSAADDEELVNDDQEPSKEDCQDYVCVSFKSNKTVIIKDKTDCQTSTAKGIIRKCDNKNAKRIKFNDLECSARSYKESIDYSNKPVTFENEENIGIDVKNKHNIHSKILEENEKDGNKASSIFESEHFDDVDDLYLF